jgi:CBS-domain-containing membrane protein
MKYTAQNCIPLQTATSFLRPPEPPRIVHLDDPAYDVMTNFNHVHPITVMPAVTIDAALVQMKIRGVRLLLVINENEEITGLITSSDIQGEHPIEIAEQQRISRSEIRVDMIMTPHIRIDVMTIGQIHRLQVGHIVETLRQLDRRHILVVEVDQVTGRQQVCGLFSMSQIKKQLRPVDEIVQPDHEPTVAGLLHELG